MNIKLPTQKYSNLIFKINHITFIQNAYRKHLVRKSREYYKHYTKDKIANQFIEDLKNDKVTKLRNQIYNNSLTRERPDLSIPSQLKVLYI